MSCFTSKDETPARYQLERERYDKMVLRKDDILIKDVTQPQFKTDERQKDTKDKKATLI